MTHKNMDWSKIITYKEIQLKASEFIINNYNLLTISKMAKILEISDYAVARGLRKYKIYKLENKHYINAPIANNLGVDKKGHYDWSYLIAYEGEELTRLQLLEKKWKFTSNSNLAIMVGLPKTAIKGKLERLGFLKRDLSDEDKKLLNHYNSQIAASKSEHWLDEVIYNNKSYSKKSFLQTFYKDLSDREISSIVGLSQSTVCKKRRNLGLKSAIVHKHPSNKKSYIRDDNYKKPVKVNPKFALYQKYINKIISYDGLDYKVSDFISEFYKSMDNKQIDAITGIGKHNISKFVRDNDILKGQNKKNDSEKYKQIKDKVRVQESYNVGNPIDMICVMTGLKEKEVIELLPYVGEGEHRNLLPPNNSVKGGKQLTAESNLTLKKYGASSLVGSYL